MVTPTPANPLLPPGFTILALETSCDETAAAIVCDGRTLVANVVASQMDQHQRYGGVVPEVASRQHILALVPVLEQAMTTLPTGWENLHAVAATCGPGLSGALLTGLNAAKAIAWQRDLPFIGVNHLDAHIYANWLIPEAAAASPSPPPSFPCVALVVSGGHTLLALLTDHGHYQLLGQTRDDAAGEAFDKVARILGLGYPGGPAIEQAARGFQGTGSLPRAWLPGTYDFSFSGLKTAVLHKVQERQEWEAEATSAAPALGASPRRKPRKNEQAIAIDMPIDQFTAQVAGAFQESVVDVLVTKTIRAAQEYGATEILLAGGVAANGRLRSELSRRADCPVRCPPVALCTDNAAMVAAAAYYRYRAGLQSDWSLDVQPNLPLGR
ncbi:MAG: tRNA (adenosine(37)-N6)-threonylcarbamoyltransferase complex transferase subunit TsaD [Chloroflexaceae bacterium]|nr:tRNA (adenosine(37)-N6)-threonylcarbamoyltransferase complex transferase subunit TsaD [Chloroflexaceae bacterium]